MTTKPFRPMLACSATLTQIRTPCYASIKYDGVRCELIDGRVLSRTLKPIPNDYIRTTLERVAHELPNLEGELIVPGGFNTTQSAVMSQSGAPDFTLHVFDVLDHANVFALRKNAVPIFSEVPNIVVVRQQYCDNAAQLEMFYNATIHANYEGIVTKAPNALYKNGRSTLRDQVCLRVKPFADDEATVVGFTQLAENDNEATLDERGYTHRSTHAAGKSFVHKLGSLLVEWTHPQTHVLTQFAIGTGFTDDERTRLWQARNALIGNVITFRYNTTHLKDAPTAAAFKGFRLV